MQQNRIAPTIIVAIISSMFVPAASAADTTMITTTNAFLTPFWFIALVISLSIGLLAFSFTRQPYVAFWMNLLSTFLAVYAAGASFITGEILPAVLTNTTTADITIPIIIYENIGILILSAGIAMFSFIMMIFSLFNSMRYTADQIDKKGP
jgi:hypothetical protein